MPLIIELLLKNNKRLVKISFLSEDYGQFIDLGVRGSKSTYPQTAQAQTKAKKLGRINNSILRGGGNAAGYLGEEAVAAYIEAKITSCNKGDEKYDYDISTFIPKQC